MQAQPPSVLPLRTDGGRWQARPMDGVWRNVEFGPRLPPEALTGWRPIQCLPIGGGLQILSAFDAEGAEAALVVDDRLEVLGSLDAASRHLSPEALQTLIGRAEDLVRDIYKHLPDYRAGFKSSPLFRMPQEALTTFCRLAEDTTRCFTLEELKTARPPLNLSLPTPSGATATVGPSQVERLFQHFPPDLAIAGRAGRVEAPALAQEGPVDAVYLVGFVGGSAIYLLSERGSGLNYYLLHSDRTLRCAYFPQVDLMLTDRELERDAVALIRRRLDEAVLTIALGGGGAPPARTERFALWSYGLLNFGHAIWDELHALDVAVSQLPPGAAAPEVFTKPGQSALDLYGPVETLYPELRGRVRRVEQPLAVIGECLSGGVTLVPRHGRGALRRTRERLGQAVAQHAAASGLAAVAAASLRPAGVDQPVVVLGLRLSNRRPPDLLGFYVRLTLAVREALGPVTVILDGINGGAEPGYAAAFVYNGVTNTRLTAAQARSDGSPELREEQAWAEQYRAAIAGRQVTVIDCVGAPILDNLYWLSQADYFVAPLGGGLAKLRWAMVKPGFVLASRVNLEGFDDLRLYDCEPWMEPPFDALDYTRPEEVVDLPLDPPRTAPPPRSAGTPHPEDFLLDEPRVIARILARLREQQGRGQS